MVLNNFLLFLSTLFNKIHDHHTPSHYSKYYYKLTDLLKHHNRSQILQILSLLLTLLHLLQVLLLQQLVLKSVASDYSVPSESWLYVKSICIALIWTSQWILFSWLGPSSHRIVPYIYSLLILGLFFFLVVFHTFLPLSQPVHHWLFLHLLFFLFRILLYLSLLVPVDCSRLLWNNKVRTRRLPLLIRWRILDSLPFLLLFLLFIILLLQFYSLLTMLEIRLYVFHVNSLNL